ncbi:uncharacterized protein LOC131151482 [Malania oleifera]|uniref:uncharacterized protein LOC131151482 n=1 Tax=Malania oleifera TaxID=397392 RepID=UPI0025AE1C90|nr:uncharacterized protein LOC131151482 [Malania oleifera]XP_057958713.1 uncharacterized protein LOC131151482 [Malania oleifera]XP_057958719.1 uncharacterized protein LOC131151482 [Malania oleifera]
MEGQSQNPSSMNLFDMYFRRADLDGDGRISGAEAVAFFQGSNLPKNVLAQVWMHADQNRIGFLGRAEFYNALKLVTVAQSKRELTPDIVKAALYGPAAAKIPAPKINLVATPAPQSTSNVAAPVTQLGGAAPATSQNIAIRGPQLLANVNMAQQHISSQQNQFVRPPQGIPPSIASHPQQGAASQGIPGGGNLIAPHPLNSNSSADWLSGNTGGLQVGVASQISDRGISPSTAQDGFGLAASGLTPSAQLKPLATTGLTVSAAQKTQDLVPSHKVESNDSKTSGVSGNGLSNAFHGDAFPMAIPQPKEDSSAPTFSAGSLPVSSAILAVSAGPQPAVKPSHLEPLQSVFTKEHLGGQLQQTQPIIKQNQQVPAQSMTAFASTGFPKKPGDSSSGQSQVPWPRMTQSAVQKYTKVFVEVDTDRDGKLTGEQARNLFLSWRLPREVLKQVWDLSDQDNDSMLSLREFCFALYLMERYREGRSLPPVLPNSVMFDETLLRTTGQPTAAYANASWGSTPGLQQPQGPTGAWSITSTAAVRPPSQISTPPADAVVQPSPQKKSRVPVLEKHLVDQLSKEEQNSLNSKFQEATEADKKVEELEKEMLDSREKTEFYRTKMQELILYKSRCDNRVNEVMERASADKREVELLMKKYEEKYKQVGDVASKLTIDEATFRGIQERKMELYQAIVKMEQEGSANGTLQVHANHIQSDLEELLKALNERCKKYGLHAKPTTLVEIPFGWQPGIQEGAADWDEDWDELEDEGFTFVKELTLDVQNVVAPPRAKSSSVQKGTSSTDEGIIASSSNNDGKLNKLPSASEQMPEEESADAIGKDSFVRSPPDSPAERNVLASPSQEFLETQSTKGIGADGSPHVRDTQSDHGGAESVVSGDKGFDDPSWGAFDTHYDTDSVWGFNPTGTKDTDQERLSENSFFGYGDLGLNPLRTNSPRMDDMFQKKGPFSFVDSVPGTPLFNSGNSPSRFSEASEDHSFNSFSRFDSFSKHDSGFFPPQDSFSRFDSIRSSRDSEHGRGFPAFDDTDPFGSTGLFKTSSDSQTPRTKESDKWSAF